MNKSVLISIQPKWCGLIAIGKKTVEVRKTRPKMDTPFKCYIYCTVNGITAQERDRNLYTDLRGKVIGEFVCDKVDAYVYDYCTHPEIGMDYDCGDSWWEIDNQDLERACMTYEQFKKYAMPNKDCMFGWHISNLVIYDMPKKIGEFSGAREPYLKRPPQNWCYVEELPR